jgi:MFS transporter, FSR family, fosmidomycin resistance protein
MSKDQTKNSNKFQTGNIVTVSFAHLVHDVYSSFLAPILPLLIEKLSMSYSMVGLLNVLQRLPALLNPFIGIVADKISVRYFIIIAPAITTISMSLLGVAPNIVVLGILLFVMGISSTLFHVPGPVMVREISGERIGKGMSFFMLGGELARTLGPLTILGAVSIWTLEGTWKLIPFGLAASFFIYLKFRNITVHQDFTQEKKSSAKGAIRKLMPIFIALIGITFFRAIMKAGMTTFLPTYLNAKGASLWFGGISLSVLEFAGAIGTIFTGTISDKIGRRPMLLIIAIATPIFMWVFIHTSGFWVVPILLVVGFFMFATQPVLLALVQDVAHDRPAFINGIYMTINFSISSVAILIIGMLGDWLGLVTAFKISTIIALGGIPFVFLLPRKKR